jgi:2-dehydro-3-deoxygluconokinase
MPDIVCLGEPLIELNEREGDGRYHIGVGGDTSNCAVAAARQGASVGYLSAIGTDGFGDRLVELWRTEGVDATHVARDPRAPTGVYFVSHGEGGHRFSYARAGSAASHMRPESLPLDYLGQAKILHVSGISQAISQDACDTVFAAIEIVRAAGGIVAYDTNLRQSLWPLPRARAIITGTLRLADIARPSIDDAKHLFGTEDPDVIVDTVLALGPKIVAVTLGADGCLVATPERRERVPRFPVEAVDATGAGDAFDGAFLVEWLRTGDPFAAARYANVAAALKTLGYGAVEPMPRRADVEAALARLPA